MHSKAYELSQIISDVTSDKGDNYKNAFFGHDLKQFGDREVIDLMEMGVFSPPIIEETPSANLANAFRGIAITLNDINEIQFDIDEEFKRLPDYTYSRGQNKDFQKKNPH